MLHDIDEVYRCEFAPAEKITANDYVAAFKDDKLLLKCGAVGGAIPQAGDFTQGMLSSTRYLFSVGGRPFFLHDSPLEETELLQYKSIQTLHSLAPQWMAFGGMTACHLGFWYAHNRYCGACGERFGHSHTERALVCPECGYTKYPEISPVVIVAITGGDELVLTRYAAGQYRRYALVAGFVEIGESLEDAVRREVLEEVGLRVKNIRYYGNQPWGFTRTLLTGFFADVDGSRVIKLDENELSEAIWVKREEIPDNESSISLTAAMIDAFKARRF